jgi:integrase
MLTFGLRVAEAAKMRIGARLKEALQSADNTATLLVQHGAKNGRSRTIPIESWQQLDVLIDALALVDGPHGSLIPFGKTWNNWRLHFYRQVHKIGLKREGEGALGLTPHSFRHENLNDLFYRVTGKPSYTGRRQFRSRLVKGGDGSSNAAGWPQRSPQVRRLPFHARTMARIAKANDERARA